MHIAPSPSEPRFEILPLAAGEADAGRLPEPVCLTVTCSPRHGVDHSLAIAERLRTQGHQAVLHLAARMVRDRRHLDAVLARVADAGMDDVFVVGGDADPVGEYASSLDVLGVIAEHPRRPRRLGVAAYPEGHPVIPAETLDSALRGKDAVADYMVTQMCFDDGTLLGWLRETRARGIAMPAYIGVPGPVDRRRLLEISMRIGVGPSVAFMRKQQGLRRLLARPARAAETLHRAVTPLIGDAELGIRGLHYYTFDRLVDTWSWHATQTRGPQRRDRRWA